ncbi:hypothetical protein [uncultured Corynebacterium sp.]|uniref:hypothetical protein n=1 Tax=uncultured Corynebacterium sp. TaxID=159447 RepID=UPI00261FE113|nr:hypothetical protein [uncultured Corynebacterium sp.]
MNLFATAEDYAQYAQADVPENIDRLLRIASAWVQDTVKRARFAVDKDGAPTDPHIVDALRDATCEQVLVWQENDVQPGKNPERGAVTSTSIGDASISYETASVVRDRELVASAVAPTALTILDAAGLWEGHPWVR